MGIERGLDLVMTHAPAPPGTAAGANVSATDVDGDGDIDLLFGRATGLPSIYLNDGDGYFEYDGQEIESFPFGPTTPVPTTARPQWLKST